MYAVRYANAYPGYLTCQKTKERKNHPCEVWRDNKVLGEELRAACPTLSRLRSALTARDKDRIDLLGSDE
jgi:hypothetical protein